MKSNVNRLRDDEDRRAAQHETVKSQLREQVHDETRRRTGVDDHEKMEIESVAHELKHKAIHEVASTENEIARARERAFRSSWITSSVSCTVCSACSSRWNFWALASRADSSSSSIRVAYPLVAPFKGLVADPSVGNFQLMLSYVIGLISSISGMCLCLH